MSTWLHIRNIAVVVFTSGKSNAVLIVTIQFKGLSGMKFLQHYYYDQTLNKISTFKKYLKTYLFPSFHSIDI